MAVTRHYDDGDTITRGGRLLSALPCPGSHCLACSPALYLITAVHASLCTLHSVHIFTPRLPAPDSCSSAALCRDPTTASRWVMQNCKTGSSVLGCVALCALCMNGWTRSRGLSHVSSQTDTSRDTRHGGGELALSIFWRHALCGQPLRCIL